MKGMIFGMFLPVVVTAVCQPAHAYYCSEPSKPDCVDGSGYFDDQSDFTSCKSEVENYVDDVRRYSECLTDETNATIRESNEIVEKFNCRAEGRSFC